MKGEMTVNDVTAVMVGEDGASGTNSGQGAVHQNHGHHGSTSSRKTHTSLGSASIITSG